MAIINSHVQINDTCLLKECVPVFLMFEFIVVCYTVFVLLNKELISSV